MLMADNVATKGQEYTICTEYTSYVYQLKHLENGLIIEFDQHHEAVFRIFLISCCCDKPTQYLVQNTSEPIGAYGCGRCILLGKTVPVKINSTYKMRVFPIDQYTLSPIRNNKLYDLFMKYIDDIGIDYDNNLRGYRGKCVLRELSYFDVTGCFTCMLKK